MDNSDETGQIFNDSLIEQYIADARDRQYPNDSRHWDAEDWNKCIQPGHSRDNRENPDDTPDGKADQSFNKLKPGKCIFTEYQVT